MRVCETLAWISVEKFDNLSLKRLEGVKSNFKSAFAVSENCPGCSLQAGYFLRKTTGHVSSRSAYLEYLESLI